MWGQSLGLFHMAPTLRFTPSAPRRAAAGTKHQRGSSSGSHLRFSTRAMSTASEAGSPSGEVRQCFDSLPLRFVTIFFGFTVMNLPAFLALPRMYNLFCNSGDLHANAM